MSRWSKDQEAWLIRHLNGEEHYPHRPARWWKVLAFCTLVVIAWDLLILVHWP